MVAASIEREILIEAPVEAVWTLVTEPDQITQWFSDEAELELRAGGRGKLTFKGSGTTAIEVEAVEPPWRFVFRWGYPEGSKPTPTNSTLVAFTLERDGSNTRLRVVESGFDKVDWTDPQRTQYLSEHAKGWSECLSRLRDLAGRTDKARR